jgi:peptidoglycan/LPS O-acetylase OafA/YrhL
MFLLGRGHLVRDLLNPFDTPSAQKLMVVVGFFLTLVVSILVRKVVSSGLRISNSFSNLAQFSYTLYVIHYPLLLLSFSLLHQLLHNYGWITSLIAAMTVLAPIVYISSRVAFVVENRALLSRLAFRTNRLQEN